MQTKQTQNKIISVVLAGNPNCGKTTLFNQLTGSKQYVGNRPGVTVEKRTGKVRSFLERDIYVTDLPGIYSLSPYTPEEIISRNCLLYDEPDVIINIVDASNLERNLYLTTQLAELAKPMVIALNMCDIVEKKGDIIDVGYLERQLGIPVIPISASRNTGIDQLIEKVVSLYDSGKYIIVKNIYSHEVDRSLREIENLFKEIQQNNNTHNRWTAIKLFEGDSVTWGHYKFTKAQKERINMYINKVCASKNTDCEMIIADERYKYICSVTQKAVTRKQPADFISISDKIDGIITNRILAIPIFFIIMLVIFIITFGAPGTFLRDSAQYLITDVFGNAIERILTALNTANWAKSLVVDGIIAGTGSVISFLPQIMLLFTMLSLLEESGYMSRAAFIMDKPLQYIGLSGKAFVPMLLGFGCTVPAVLATRTLENIKSKRMTIMLIPFMSCSAKMPVYMLLISYFFADKGFLVVFAIYLLGITAAILTALLFNNTALKGKKAPFVMELPPYHIPTLKSLKIHVAERMKDFMIKAGTILLGASILIWFLQSFDFSFKMVSPDESMLAIIGKFIAPVFSVCGFGDWRASVSLLTGIAAKESVASTLSVLYNGTSIANTFTPLSAFSFLVFILLYTPCIAALSAIHKEMKSAKWTAVTIIYQIFAAWLASALVFQVGTLILNLI